MSGNVLCLIIVTWANLLIKGKEKEEILEIKKENKKNPHNILLDTQEYIQFLIVVYFLLIIVILLIYYCLCILMKIKA